MKRKNINEEFLEKEGEIIDIKPREIKNGEFQTESLTTRKQQRRKWIPSLGVRNFLPFSA